MKTKIDLARVKARRAARIGLRVAARAAPLLVRAGVRSAPWIGIALAVAEVAAEILDGDTALEASGRSVELREPRTREPVAPSSEAAGGRESDLLRRWAEGE
jgi:hypothetical protein